MSAPKLFFLAILCLFSAQTKAQQDETAVDDFVAAMAIAASQYAGQPAAAIEATRTLLAESPTGVNVNILEPRQNHFAAVNFLCPYQTPGSVLVEQCNSQPAAAPATEPLASLLGAIEELAEAAADVQLDPASIHFIKAWKPNDRIVLVRASFSSPSLGNGNAIFSCHNTAHGNEAPHMHCHYNSANPVGPNEPFASVR